MLTCITAVTATQIFFERLSPGSDHALFNQIRREMVAAEGCSGCDPLGAGQTVSDAPFLEPFGDADSAFQTTTQLGLAEFVGRRVVAVDIKPNQINIILLPIT